MKTDQSSSQLSDNLKIFFDIEKLNLSDTIIPNILGPNYSNSKYDKDAKFAIAKKSFTTNNVVGDIYAVAKYINNMGVTITSDTLKLEFKE